tara:strand:+ start:814 stop:960 length:147 start_codon:yes stop_codon:yes gene_type:complete
MIEFKQVNRPLDCKKITSLEEVKLILDALKPTMKEDCEHYDKLKHLLK